jgi:hypothetical protein
MRNEMDYDDTVRDGDGAQRLGSKAGQGTFSTPATIKDVPPLPEKAANQS